MTPFVISSFVLWTVATGELTIVPLDRDVTVGGRAVLNCRSNSEQKSPIQWHHTPVGLKTRRVYDQGKFLLRYKEGFQIVGNLTEGEFNLEIKDAGLKDAGTYTCSDTTDSEGRAELTVLESYPSKECCSTSQPRDGAIGFDCGVPKTETIHLSCNLSYVSNRQAILEWTDSAGKTYKTETTVIGNITMYSAVLKATEFNFTSRNFICGVVYKDSNTRSDVKWSTSIHALKNDTKSHVASCNTKSVNCALNMSPHNCSYVWRQSPKNGLVHEGSILPTEAIQNEVIYICTAMCSIHGRTCKVTPATYIYHCPEEGKVKNLTGTLTIIIGVSILLLSMLMLAGFLYIKKKKQKDAVQQQTEKSGIPEDKQLIDSNGEAKATNLPVA